MVFSCNVCGGLTSESEAPPNYVGSRCPSKLCNGVIVRGRSHPSDRCPPLTDDVYDTIALLQIEMRRHEAAARDIEQRIRQIYAQHAVNDGAVDYGCAHLTRVNEAHKRLTMY